MADPRLAALDAAVRAAGLLALTYAGKVSGERKADSSLVTEADRAVERFLVERLRAIEASAGVLGEEGTSDGAPHAAAGATWVVDPIDGTAMFVAGLPTWSISVGLVRDGAPELGCVHLPVAGEMFLAGATGPLLWNGAPIQRNGAAGKTVAGLDRQAFVCLPANHHRRYRVSFPAKVRSFGSTAAHFAWAARGAAVAAVAHAHVWDVAGALACCRAAGIDFGYLSGAPVDLGELLDGRLSREPIIAAHRDDLGVVRGSVEYVSSRSARSAPAAS